MPALHLNDAGTWRHIQNVYVNDAGAWRPIQKVWMNDAGTWRQVYVRRPPETFSVSAGQNGTGGAYGYVFGSYGSIIGATLTDVAIVRQFHDNNPVAQGGSGTLAIAPTTGTLTQDYFTSITANGVTRLAVDASFSFVGGQGIWTWATGFNLLGGVSYDPITITF